MLKQRLRSAAFWHSVIYLKSITWNYNNYILILYDIKEFVLGNEIFEINCENCISIDNNFVLVPSALAITAIIS